MEYIDDIQIKKQKPSKLRIKKIRMKPKKKEKPSSKNALLFVISYYLHPFEFSSK